MLIRGAETTLNISLKVNIFVYNILMVMKWSRPQILKKRKMVNSSKSKSQ